MIKAKTRSPKELQELSKHQLCLDLHTAEEQNIKRAETIEQYREQVDALLVLKDSQLQTNADLRLELRGLDIMHDQLKNAYIDRLEQLVELIS